MTTFINASTSSGLVVTPDNSGVVQLQYNGVAGPAFNAALTGVGGGVTVTQNNPIIFNTTQYERGGTNYNTSNGRFTAPVTGFYFFAVNLLIDATQSTQDTNVKFFINGASPAVGGNSLYTNHTGGQYQMLTGSCLFSLTAGQYVTVVAGSTSTAFYSGTATDIQTHFMGYLIA